MILCYVTFPHMIWREAEKDEDNGSKEEGIEEPENPLFTVFSYHGLVALIHRRRDNAPTRAD